MNRVIILFMIILSSFLLIACSKTDTGNHLINIGESSKFKKEEISEAINQVKKNFNFPAATLTKICYDEEKSESLITSYLQNGKGLVNGVKPENVIILLSEFYVDDSGDNPVLNPDSTYTDYQWILIRDNNKSDWIIDDKGY